MNEAINDLCNFILENGGAGSVTVNTIENWFRLIRQAVFASRGEGAPEISFKLLTEGMAGQFYKEGITTPKLLEAIRKYCADYILASVEAAPDLNETEIEYRPVRANSMVMTNTLLSNMLPTLINKGETTIATGRLKSKNPLTETVNITMAPREVDGVIIEGNYTLFHEAVFSACLSLWIAGNTTITPHLVRRFLSQDYKSKNLSPPSITEITEAIEDLRRLHIKVDMTEEMERRGVKTSGTPYFGAFMLMLNDLEIPIGGEVAKGYGFIQPPILYEHALKLNQLQSFPAKLLAITDENGKRIRTTKNRTKIQIYLLKQISNIENDLKRAKAAYHANEARRKKDPDGVKAKSLKSFRKMNDNILFDTIFEKTDLAGKQNKELLDYKSYIKTCLKNWGPDGAGRIKGFTVLNDGRRKDVETGVRILLD